MNAVIWISKWSDNCQNFLKIVRYCSSDFFSCYFFLPYFVIVLFKLQHVESLPLTCFWKYYVLKAVRTVSHSITHAFDWIRNTCIHHQFYHAFQFLNSFGIFFFGRTSKNLIAFWTLLIVHFCLTLIRSCIFRESVWTLEIKSMWTKWLWHLLDQVCCYEFSLSWSTKTWTNFIELP